jgi:multiple sugar transport system substrate-binding protein
MIRRRHLLAATASALAAPAIVERANAQSAFDWKQFKGQSIEVNYQLSPRGDIAKAHIKDFEELTGIKVGSSRSPNNSNAPRSRWKWPPAIPASTWSMSACMSRSV